VTAALALAESIAAVAPLAVQATLANARLARSQGPSAAAERLQPELMRLLATKDATRGFEAFATRSVAEFKGD
jgi:enoyl-CoA hydratase/carnithine racemase